MDVYQPQTRRRGFFLHSQTGEPEIGETENAEGVQVRIRISRSSTPRRFSSARRGRSDDIDEGHPQIRSGSVTGSRQRAHLPR